MCKDGPYCWLTAYCYISLPFIQKELGKVLNAESSQEFEHTALVRVNVCSFHTGAAFPCCQCKVSAVPQYHLAMVDGTIRNFCSYECVLTYRVTVSSYVTSTC